MNEKTPVEPIERLPKWMKIANYIAMAVFISTALMYALIPAEDFVASGSPEPINGAVASALALIAASLLVIENYFITRRKRAAIIAFTAASIALLPLQEAIFYFMGQPFSNIERLAYYPLTAILVHFAWTNKRILATFPK